MAPTSQSPEKAPPRAGQSARTSGWPAAVVAGCGLEDSSAAARAWRWVAVLLFGYVLARPVSSNVVLVPVLAAMGAVAVGAILVCRRRLSPVLLPCLLTTFTFAFVGLAAGPTTPGFWSSALVFVAAPLLYWLATAALDEKTLRLVFHAAAVVTTFIGTTVALYAAQNAGLVPSVVPSWLLNQYGAGFGQQAGASFGGSNYTQVRFYALSTLVATGPMWVGSLFVDRDSLLPPRWLRVTAALAATAGALTGGRRALALVLILTPVLVWLMKISMARPGSRRPSTKRRGGLVVGGLAAVVAVGFFPGIFSGGVVGAAWQSVTSYATHGSFTGASAAEDSVRNYQAARLIEAWSQSPVFGHGFGATMHDFWRDPIRPWRWELQYHALLFETGIVGALIVVFGVAATANTVLRAARTRPDLMPSLIVACAGAAGMLIGNASNPYLQAPGHVWSIFLPLAVANVILTSGESRGAARLGGWPWRRPVTTPLNEPAAVTDTGGHESPGRTLDDVPGAAISR